MGFYQFILAIKIGSKLIKSGVSFNQMKIFPTFLEPIVLQNMGPLRPGGLGQLKAQTDLLLLSLTFVYGRWTVISYISLVLRIYFTPFQGNFKSLQYGIYLLSKCKHFGVLNA